MPRAKALTDFGLGVLLPGISVLLRLQCQRRGAGPVSHFEAKACRHGRVGVGGAEIVDRRSRDRHRHGLPCRGVLRQLKMSVDHVVGGVVAVEHRFAGHPPGLAVGGDRFLPVAHAREDVRGHVKRMRRVGRDGGIGFRRRQALLGDRRIVVAVDQVVGDAGMVRMCLEQRFEYRGGLELVGVVLVGGIEIRRGDQRRQDLGLGVVRISGHDRRHGGVDGLHALGIGLSGVPAHEDTDGSDIVLLALAPQSRSLRRIECRDDAVETRRREKGGPGEWVLEDRQGMAPMRHATRGIGALDRLEGGDRLRPGEGMVKRHGRVELRLCGRIAIDTELDRAQARNCVLVCTLCLCRYRRGERARRSDAQQYRKRASHGGPLWLCASKRQQDEPVGRPGQARLGARYLPVVTGCLGDGVGAYGMTGGTAGSRRRATLRP